MHADVLATHAVHADPDHDPDHDDALLTAAMALSGRRLAILTGAGISTDSGIPDYRGEGTRQRTRRPVRFAEYVENDSARRRYWARAFIGWPRLRDAAPNHSHVVVGDLVGAGRAVGVITQNVDGLHQRGGAARVVELHGALRLVRCLRCERRLDRDEVQAALVEKNAGWSFDSDNTGRDKDAPDGDVDLEDRAVEGFVVVDCVCGGPLKPDVVFFGENVAAPVLDDAWRVFQEAQALLVLGTSLEVYSGRRFVLEARKRALPTVLVTRGPTRADADVTVKLDAGIAPTLTALFGARAVTMG